MRDYKAVLDAAWNDHMAPRASDAPTVASLFAGCGGSSLGYSMSGYREVLAVEWEDHAVETLLRNFPHVRVHHGDVAKVRADDLGMDRGELDVLDGSPPCQGFSMIGSRQLDDPRNFLFLEFVRLLREWQPRAMVMENVPSLATGHNVAVYHEIIRAIQAEGYIVRARVLDCSLLGVPQKRKRLVLVGFRSDLGIDPVHPRPFRSRPWTVREAISDISRSGDLGLVAYPTGRAAILAPHIAQGADGASVIEPRGKKRAYYSLCRARPDSPSRTVVKRFAAGMTGLLHPSHDRYMSSREITRLQSFPDQFEWGTSDYGKIHARVGNSVPPLMMREVSRVIADRLSTA